MKLNEHTNMISEKVSNLEEEILPLEDQNVLDWRTEDSEEDPCVVIPSARKSRSSKKCKRKGRRNKGHPAVDPSKYVGDEPKVSPRFNLRDRATIKKVCK
jgi:hypothetical protein